MASKNVQITRILDKIKRLIKDGGYYEAHQMYKSLYFRYLPLEKYKELSDILYDGINIFLDHNRTTSGADLGILLIELLVKSNPTDDYELWMIKLSKIFSRIPSTTPERDQFLVNAIRWSSIYNNKQTSSASASSSSSSSTSTPSFNGHPLLHERIAQVYWIEKNYSQARHHFIYSKDGTDCAKLLIEFQCQQGYKCEIDLFITQTVLQYLCLRNIIAANLAFNCYTQKHPLIKKYKPPYILPLLNFIFFLLKAVESRKLETFAVLCQQYEPSIKRDPCYVEYLDKIGQIFFGIKPSQPKKGIFEDFLELFLNGMDNTDDEQQQQQPQQQQQASTSSFNDFNSQLD